MIPTMGLAGPGGAWLGLAEPGFANEIKGEVFDRLIKEGFHVVAPNGILGDARGAIAEMGKALVEALAEEITKVDGSI